MKFGTYIPISSLANPHYVRIGDERTFVARVLWDVLHIAASIVTSQCEQEFMNIVDAVTNVVESHVCEACAETFKLRSPSTNSGTIN